MSIRNFLEDVGNGVMYLISMAQLEAVLRIFSFSLSILISILIIISRALDWWKKLKEWWNKSKEDGKITQDEIKEGISILSEGAKDIKEQIDSHTKKGD